MIKGECNCKKFVEVEVEMEWGNGEEYPIVCPAVWTSDYFERRPHEVRLFALLPEGDSGE